MLSDEPFAAAAFAKSRRPARGSDRKHNRRGCYDNSAACWSPLSKKTLPGPQETLSASIRETAASLTMSAIIKSADHDQKLPALDS